MTSPADPVPTHFLEKEGASWLPWPFAFGPSFEFLNSASADFIHRSLPVHALKYADGRIWDSINQWRLPVATRSLGNPSSKIKSVRTTRYRASDGTIFDTRNEAELHEIDLELAQLIASYDGILSDNTLDFLRSASNPLSIILRKRVNLRLTTVTQPKASA